MNSKDRNISSNDIPERIKKQSKEYNMHPRRLYYFYNRMIEMNDNSEDFSAESLIGNVMYDEILNKGLLSEFQHHGKLTNLSIFYIVNGYDKLKELTMSETFDLRLLEDMFQLGLSLDTHPDIKNVETINNAIVKNIQTCNGNSNKWIEYLTLYNSPCYEIPCSEFSYDDTKVSNFPLFYNQKKDTLVFMKPCQDIHVSELGRPCHSNSLEHFGMYCSKLRQMSTSLTKSELDIIQSDGYYEVVNCYIDSIQVVDRDTDDIIHIKLKEKED